MEIVGYLAAIGIGITLGLLGGGGSILTVPVLVYLFSINPISATAYSLFIVGLTSAIGSVSYLRQNLIEFKTAIIFGVPSIVSVLVIRRFILPALPDLIIQTDLFALTKENFILLLFALVMQVAGISMLRSTNQTKKEIDANDQLVHFTKKNYFILLLAGLSEGFLSGMVGAGGGFLIIPALVLLCKINIKTAVGTSLFIISIKSLLGFFADKSLRTTDWKLLLSLTAFACLGLAVGIFISKKTENAKLKPLFAYFLIAMSMFMLIKEIVS